MSFAVIGSAFAKIAKISGGLWKKFAGSMVAVAKAGKQSAGVVQIASGLGQLISLANPFTVVFGALAQIFTVFGAMLSTALIPAIETLFDVFFSPAVLNIINQLTMVLGVLMAGIMPSLVAIFLALLPTLQMVIDLVSVLVDALMPLMPLLTQIIVTAIQIINIALQPLIDILIMLLPPVMMIIGVLLGLIQLALVPFQSILEALMPIIILVVDIIALLANLIAITLTGGLGFVIPVILIFVDILARLVGFITKYLNPVINGVVKAFDGITGAFRKVIAGVFGFINGLIKGLNKIPFVNIPLVKVPALAEGGIVTSPTLALIGEAGPEAVIPLNGRNGGGGTGGTGGGLTVNIGSVLDDSTMRQLSDFVYAQGRKDRLMRRR